MLCDEWRVEVVTQRHAGAKSSCVIARYIANVGDSTAILAKKTSGKAYGWEQITRLHRLSDEDERLKGQSPCQVLFNIVCDSHDPPITIGKGM